MPQRWLWQRLRVAAGFPPEAASGLAFHMAAGLRPVSASTAPARLSRVTYTISLKGSVFCEGRDRNEPEKASICAKYREKKSSSLVSALLGVRVLLWAGVRLLLPWVHLGLPVLQATSGPFLPVLPAGLPQARPCPSLSSGLSAHFLFLFLLASAGPRCVFTCPGPPSPVPAFLVFLSGTAA